MNNIKAIVLTVLTILCFSYHNSFSQTKDKGNTGYIEGQVLDSIHNYVLKSATVSVYDSVSLDIVSYQLTNNFGRFSFNNLPIAKALKIVVTHIGYQPLKKVFSIPNGVEKLDLKILNMFTAENNLDEIKIFSKKPPMQMKGDTLEFNADAFKLDTNAVVEDLLRMLPAVTIWNDGLITVNGKKISSLMVDGKPFFGGNTKIATQNLPKNAVEKIQIYQNKNNKEDLDPQTEMNIVLKTGKKFGYFGKFGGGYGTDERYSGEGMLSMFNPKAQLSIIATRNNVNKTASSVEDLMQYSSFKGEGLGTSFSSDFTKPGENISTAAGYTLSYNFDPENKLKNDYFYNNQLNTINENLTTITTLEDGVVVQSNTRGRSGKSIRHRNSGDFTHTEKFKELTIRYNLENLKGETKSSQDILTESSSTGLSSNQNQSEHAEVNETHVLLFAAFNSNKYYDSRTNTFKSINLNLDYSFKLDDFDNLVQKTTDFTTSNANENLKFNRRYDKSVRNSTHTLNNRFRNVPSLFGINKMIVNIDLKNRLVLGSSREKQQVSDLDQNNTLKSLNPYLSNQSKNITILERPGIEVYKSIRYFLANRYSKTWTFRGLAELQGFRQQNVSQKQFQTLTRSYLDFLPSATAQLSYLRNNRFNKEVSVSLISSVNYPGISQLVPLTDSSNVNYLEYANTTLKASKTKELLAKYQHSSVGTNSPLSYSLEIKAGRINDSLSDSSHFDSAGRNVHYYANVAHAHYAGYVASLYKAYTIKDHQLQLTLRSLSDFNEQPAYVNSRLIDTRNSYYFNSLTVGESYKGIINLSIAQSAAFSTRVQGAGKYTYDQFVSTINLNLNWPKNVILNSDLNFNKNRSSFNTDLNYTIWNANISYRFLSGRNAEIKFSAMDLLHQNSSIVNYRDNYSVSRGTVNVLQQYFLFSLSYFPRKFGSGK